MQLMDNKRLAITADEAAAELGVSKPTMYAIARSEGFPAVRVGRRVIIPRKEFEEWLSESAMNRTEIELDWR